jgi:hypothetical protein
MNAVELRAREVIRDVIARYAHCADTGRFAELAALFVDDGTLAIDGRPALQGRRAILEFLQGVQRDRSPGAGPTRLIRHHVSSVRIAVESPDRASAKSYFLAVTDAGPDHSGVYRDRFVRAGGAWLFVSREVTIDGLFR